MPQRRIIAAIAAALLTVIAAVILVSYVGGADRRAAAALQPQQVLVIAKNIPKGTPAGSLGDSVEVKSIPQSAVVAGSVASVTDLGNRVAGVDLVAGEQVLASRFVDPANLQSAQVPAGLQEISIQLNAERIYGGLPQPGNKVGVITTWDAGKGKQTKVMLNNVLITRVQGGVQPSAAPTDGKATTTDAPQATIMLTLALSTHDAEKVVWAKENGSLWLSLQNPATNTAGSRPATSENLTQ